ncbi:rhodanese-like domain-containing protein [Cesiribacter andamanensis]|uniref:rhodanese-like domain-containing protein n=1 Tax=Cesiribacter andamanensis TaxID=649507 RepID=UPI00137873FB|nr:rhodanese-like domain-containing protein [Cesiribacter andamanensis]
MAVLVSCGVSDKAALSPLQFIAAQSTQPGQLIDVRLSAELETASIGRALLLNPDDAPTFKRSINKLNRKQVFYLYCTSGNRGAQAAALMRQAGFSQVYYLKGGLLSLQQEGYNVAAL